MSADPLQEAPKSIAGVLPAASPAQPQGHPIPHEINPLETAPINSVDVHAQLLKLHHHLSTSYSSYGARQFFEFQMNAVRALRIARDFPDQSEPLVGETYLLAAMVSIFRERQDGYTRHVSNRAIEFIERAYQVRGLGHWKDPTIEERCEMLRHQAENCTWDSYVEKNSYEIRFISWLLDLKTDSQFAASQIAAFAVEEARLKLLDDLPLISYPLMKQALEFARRNPSLEKSLLMQICGNYGFSVAKAHLSADMSISDQRRESALTEGIGYLERAADIGKRILGNSMAEGYIQARIFRLQLMCDPRSEIGIEDAATELARIMVESTELIDGNLIGMWVDLHLDYLNGKYPYNSDSINDPEATILRRKHFNEMIPVYLRAIQLTEKLPENQRPPDLLESLRNNCAYMMLDLDRHTDALQVLSPVAVDTFKFLDDSARSFLQMQFRALVNTAQYDRAKRAADIILSDLNLRDSLNINCAENTAQHLRLAGEMTDVDPEWAADVINRILPDLGRLEGGYLHNAIRIVARLSHLVGRKEQAEEWIAILDQVQENELQEDPSPRAPETGDSADEQFDGTSSWQQEDEETTDEHVPSYRLTELIVRTTILLNASPPPIDRIQTFLEIIRSEREEGGFIQTQYPPIVSECFALDGKLSLLTEEYDQAIQFFEKGLEFLDFARPADRFFIASNMEGIGLAYARKEMLQESNDYLMQSLAIFDEFTSPTINHVQVITQLMENYTRLGDEEQTRHYRQRLVDIVHRTEKIPVLHATIIRPKSEALDDLF